MSPFFNPGAISHPNIPIYIAGANTGLASLAGEVADGFLVHPFHSPAYLKEVLLAGDSERRSGCRSRLGRRYRLGDRFHDHQSGGAQLCPIADRLLCFHTLLPAGNGPPRLGVAGRGTLPAGVSRQVGCHAGIDQRRDAVQPSPPRQMKMSWATGCSNAMPGWRTASACTPPTFPANATPSGSS